MWFSREAAAIPERGRFITLEGGEGAGKSTLLNGLVGRLSTHGLDIRATREPGGTPLAQRVRELVLSPGEGHAWSPLAEALLMNAARADHLEKLIRPALRDSVWVLCDRFMDSTRAYQSTGGASPDTLDRLERMTVAETRPDLTLILDAAPEDLLARRKQRGGTDAFEGRNLDFHRGVRAAFLAIAEADPARCVVIDATQSEEKLLDAAWAVIAGRFGMEASS